MLCVCGMHRSRCLVGVFSFFLFGLELNKGLRAGRRKAADDNWKKLRSENCS
jgi:hypothetical protein